MLRYVDQEIKTIHCGNKIFGASIRKASLSGFGNYDTSIMMDIKPKFITVTTFAYEAITIDNIPETFNTLELKAHKKLRELVPKPAKKCSMPGDPPVKRANDLRMPLSTIHPYHIISVDALDSSKGTMVIDKLSALFASPCWDLNNAGYDAMYKDVQNCVNAGRNNVVSQASNKLEHPAAGGAIHLSNSQMAHYASKDCMFVAQIILMDGMDWKGAFMKKQFGNEIYKPFMFQVFRANELMFAYPVNLTNPNDKTFVNGVLAAIGASSTLGWSLKTRQATYHKIVGLKTTFEKGRAVY